MSLASTACGCLCFSIQANEKRLPLQGAISQGNARQVFFAKRERSDLCSMYSSTLLMLVVGIRHPDIILWAAFPHPLPSSSLRPLKSLQWHKWGLRQNSNLNCMNDSGMRAPRSSAEEPSSETSIQTAQSSQKAGS